VLVIFHEEQLGGATRSTLRLIPLLREQGWDFAFWAPKPSPLTDRLHGLGVEVHGAPRVVSYGLTSLRAPPGGARRLLRLPGYLASLRSLVRELDPVLVHANSLYSLAEATAARAAGARILFYVYEIVPRGWKGAAARRLAGGVSRQTVAISEASASSLAIGRARPTTIFGGAPLPPRPVALRRDPRPFVVGTVGVVARRKGSDLFVEAARRVRTARPETRFRMVGAVRGPRDAAWQQSLIRQARDVGVEHVEQANVQRELATWDAFVLPSRKDPFPIAMLEAMASGLPVIGTRSGGISEQVAAGCGMLVPPEDPRALAEAIVELMQLPYEVRRSMGEKARARVEERFTLEHQADGLHRAYLAVSGLQAHG
jgi:glycosyltransferase involved in cell wall biosynthesis